MGNKYEVNSWVALLTEEGALYDYRYEEVYRGQSLVKALWNCWKQKILGIGCVKLEIR